MPPDGWTSPVYQSLTQPHLVCGVPQDVWSVLLTVAMIGILWWLWWLPVSCGVLYGVARLATRADPAFFAVLLEHVHQADHYEG